jgi:hypothetical protein
MRPRLDPRTFGCPRETEDWLRSSLFGLTGQCWKLSYTNMAGASMNNVLFASSGDKEIAYCGGEPRSHELLSERVGNADTGERKADCE